MPNLFLGAGIQTQILMVSSKLLLTEPSPIPQHFISWYGGQDGHVSISTNRRNISTYHPSLELFMIIRLAQWPHTQVHILFSNDSKSFFKQPALVDFILHIRIFLTYENRRFSRNLWSETHIYFFQIKFATTCWAFCDRYAVCVQVSLSDNIISQNENLGERRVQY